MKHKYVLGIPAAAALAVWAGHLAYAGNFAIDWFTIDGGGAMLTVGGGFELSGTIGQADAGVMTGGDFELSGGFWPGAAALIVLPGDCDGSTFLELDDFEIFSPCVAGPGVGVAPGCDCADLDGDLDADLVDFGLLANAWPPS